MNGRSTQPSQTSSPSWWRQFSPTTALLVACLCLFPSTIHAYPRTVAPARGLVVEILAPNSTLSRSGLQTGDVITHWAPLTPAQESRRQPDSAFNWFWFTSELLPRGPVEVVFAREGRLLETIVFPGAIGARVRPVLSEGDLLLYSGMAHLVSNDSASEAARLGEELFERQRNATGDFLSWVSHLTATAYTRSKDLPKAMEWYSRALEYTHDPLTRIYIWQSIGIAYQSAGQTWEAESTYQTALSITRTALAGSLIETTSLSALHLLAWKSRDLDNVRRYVSQEVEILTQQAPSSLQLADSWEMLGVLSSRAGNLDQAKNYHQQTLALRQVIAPESRDTARSLINLGNLEMLGDKYTEARALYLLALGALQKTAPDSPEVAPLYANLGRVETALGNLAEAGRMYHASMEHTPEDEVGRLAVLKSLSYLAQKRGDFIQAEDWSRQAADTLEKRAPLSSEMADSLTSLASIRYQMGDLERAKDLFESALSLNQKLGRDELDIASGFNNIASVLNRGGDPTGAEALWRKVLEIYKRRQPNSLSAARVLHNLGEARRSLNDYEAALRFFQQALAIERRSAPFSVETVTTLWRLGSALRDLRRYEEALAFQAESVTIAQRAPLAESIQAQALHEQSNTLKRLARFSQALESLHSAVDLLEAQTDKIVDTDDNRIQFRSKFAEIYRDYVHALADQGQGKAAFTIQELFLARGLAFLFAERDLIFRDAPPELEASRVRLAAEYDLTQQKLAEAYEAKGDEKIKSLTRMLRDVRDRQNNVNSMLRQSSPHLASFRDPEPLSVENAQASLDHGTLALSFDINTDASLLFALMPDGTFRVHTIDIGSDDLRRGVSQFMGLLRERPTTLRRNTLLSQARHLYKTLLSPVDDLIERSKRILLMPDGPLHSLTFAALVKDSQGSSEEKGWRFLAEHRPLHLASSLTTSRLHRTLQGRDAGKAPREELVAFGDPAYPLNQSEQHLVGDPHVRTASVVSSLAPLPWSRREVESIVELFPGHSELYLGDDATERAAKAALESDNNRYIHFAGHGYLDQKFPLNSAVVLAIPKSFRFGEENGLLQAWEILEQIRLDADLVVLSACESGLGKEMGGEGLIGLTRAFQYAGARSVVASLWKISDRTTAEFMVRFYRHLKEGLPKDEALRATQMEFIRGPIQVTNDKGERVDFDASAPYYWAAFQIYGDWQ